MEKQVSEKQAVKILVQYNNKFYKETLELLNKKLGVAGVKVAKQKGHLMNLLDNKKFAAENFAEDVKTRTIEDIEDYIIDRVNKMVKQYQWQLIEIIEDTQVNMQYGF